MSAMRSSAVRELLKVTSQPDVISFAGGLPGPDLFPVERFEEACHQVLQHHGREALQYGTTEGQFPLRELVARQASRCGVTLQPENVLITSGSQQGLDLLGKVFVNPGDRVLVERPTYLGALQAWNGYQAAFVAVDVDQDGLLMDRLEMSLRERPKFAYVLPNFQNPTGATLSLDRRRTLVRLANEYQIPILEDDPYGQLAYDAEPLPPLIALDAVAGSGSPSSLTGNVIGLGSFSKLLAPGLRLGWMLGPAEIIERLALAKQGTDLHTSTFTQMVACEVSQDGFLDEHVRRLRAVYRIRRDTMLAAMEEHFPENVRWTRPAGGLFLWVTLPEPADAGEILRGALAENVAFVPGQSFFADGTGRNTFRLNYSFAPPPVIEEGIRRLGRVLQRTMNADPRATTACPCP